MGLGAEKPPMSLTNTIQRIPPKIDIQTRINGVQHFNQNFALHTVFNLVAYFFHLLYHIDNVYFVNTVSIDIGSFFLSKNDFFVNSKILPLMNFTYMTKRKLNWSALSNISQEICNQYLYLFTE
jgi:hypothetical protein